MTTTNDKLRSLFLSALMVMSVFAGATAFAGTAAANHAEDIPDSETTKDISSTDIVFQGQYATYTNTSLSGQTITLYDSEGTYIDEYSVDSSGHVAFDTDNLDGRYFLGGTTAPGSGDGDEAQAAFQVVQQSFPVSPDSVNLTTQDNVTFEVGETNRAGSFEINITGDGVAERNGDPGYEMNVTENTEYSQDVFASDISSGQHTFTFDVVDTTTSEEMEVNVTEGDISYSMANPYPTDERGDVGTFTINLENTRSAYVQFGSAKQGFSVGANVTDDNDDGKVTLALHTYATNTSNNSASDILTLAGDSAGEDSISGQRNDVGTSLENPIEAGDYPITVYDEFGGSEKTFGTFVLNERSTDGAQSWVAPQGASVSDADEVYNAIAEGDTVAMNDYAVVEVQASGLYDYIDSDTNLPKQGVSVDITQANPGPNQDGNTITNYDVVTDAENNTLFLVVNTGGSDIEADQEYQATFTVNESNKLIANEDATESVNTTFSIAERSVSYDTTRDDVYAVPQGEYNVSGSATFAPGTEFQVTARSTAANLLQSRTVTVGPDGEWSATFDFSDVENGTEFTFTNSRVDDDTADAIVDSSFQPDDGGDTTTTASTTETTTTETTTTETTTTETTTETTTTTTEDTTTTEGGDGGIPGFGVSVSLVALLAAALLALRRSN